VSRMKDLFEDVTYSAAAVERVEALSVLSPRQRTQRSAPDTSLAAAASVNVSASALKVLRVYDRLNRPLLDFEAYHHAFDKLASGIGARCHDLRHNGLIERTGVRKNTPSGRAGYLCLITDKGRRYVKEHSQ
jgi:hypothetical protein